MNAINDINEIRLIQLEILSALDKFCREKRIKYFLIDGTLLGAIRHKGYIPWDDDIDVALDRKNYERLVREFPVMYEGKYRLHSLETNPKWDRAYGCISDERTQLVYDGNSAYAPGLLIDLFPIDEVPDDNMEWKMLATRLFVLSRITAIKACKSFRISKSFAKNVLVQLIKLLLLPVSQKQLVTKKDKLAKSNNGKGYSYGYEVAFGLGANNRFKLEDFFEVVDVQFEGRFFMAPRNYDSVLSDTYGDYMKLPPEEERVSHHSFKAYWK